MPTIHELRFAAMDKALDILSRYPRLATTGKASDLVKLLEMAYLEGHLDGMKRGHEIDMKVIADVTNR